MDLFSELFLGLAIVFRCVDPVLDQINMDGIAKGKASGITCG